VSLKTVVLKSVALALISAVGLLPNGARAEELPDAGGGCTGQPISTVAADHCCTYNSCYYFFNVYAIATITHYENNCSVPSHLGTDGCCFFE
jgi:hypothetical protein